MWKLLIYRLKLKRIVFHDKTTDLKAVLSARAERRCHEENKAFFKTHTESGGKILYRSAYLSVLIVQ